MNQEIANFLEKSNISEETWVKAKVDFSLLQEIGEDHKNNIDRLKKTAELYASLIQNYAAVHSVRWRVKDPVHVMEKIVRKKSEGIAKYNDISTENYYEKITDLVGVRAIHLFKDECFDIDTHLRSIGDPIETPIAYMRSGDEYFTKDFQDRGFEIKIHPAGYRSIHYVFSTKPLLRTVLSEIQVRTIFEEGWSEIDHQIRYPNFSDNTLINYFLTIFNRMAGSADEMGSFVKGLITEIETYESKIIASGTENNKNAVEISKLFAALESSQEQNQQSKDTIKKLKEEVENLRKNPYDIFSENSLKKSMEIEKRLKIPYENALARILSSNDLEKYASILSSGKNKL